MLAWPRRRLRAALAWLEAQWDRPDRHDHYLMSLAAEVRRSWVADKKKVRLEDFRLAFGRQEEAAKPTKEQAAAWAKAKWLPWLKGQKKKG